MDGISGGSIIITRKEGVVRRARKADRTGIVYIVHTISGFTL
jgi:hypothetical protein